MIRFLQTSDWQLGMTRHFLSDGAQERFSQARFDAIRAMGRLAADEQCRFMVVCGDAFESNQVDRRTVARALEALRDVPVPVYILPGNHDPLNEASVYRSSAFRERKPAHVSIIENAEPIKAGDGVELVGAPWLSKKPVTNPLEEALAQLPPAAGVIRICLAHGAVDCLVGDHEPAGMLRLAMLERAMAEGKAHYVALGDRHSLTKVGPGGRVWYCGTPEPTDFSENETGRMLIVEIDEAGLVSTRAVGVGRWSFVERAVQVESTDGVESLGRSLDAMPDKERTVVRLRLEGSLSLSLRATLDKRLAAAADLFGALDVRDDGLLAVPDDTDFSSLELSGFARSALERLRRELSAGLSGSGEARDALMLLLRLAGRQP